MAKPRCSICKKIIPFDVYIDICETCDEDIKEQEDKEYAEQEEIDYLDKILFGAH